MMWNHIESKLSGHYLLRHLFLPYCSKIAALASILCIWEGLSLRFGSYFCCISILVYLCPTNTLVKLNNPQNLVSKCSHLPMAFFFFNSTLALLFFSLAILAVLLFCIILFLFFKNYYYYYFGCTGSSLCAWAFSTCDAQASLVALWHVGS